MPINVCYNNCRNYKYATPTCFDTCFPEDDTSCVEKCRSSLYVISTIIVTDIYVHSLVELKIKIRTYVHTFLPRILYAPALSTDGEVGRNMLYNTVNTRKKVFLSLVAY